MITSNDIKSYIRESLSILKDKFGNKIYFMDLGDTFKPYNVMLAIIRDISPSAYVERNFFV